MWTTKVAEIPSDDPSLIALIRVIFYKRLILLVRYPVNTAAQIFVMILLFSLIFFGGRSIVGPALTDSLSGIIIGFFLFSLAISSYSGIAWNIIREAQWGTLERLFMSPHGFETVIVIKIFANICINFLQSFILLLLMMFITDKWLIINPLTVVSLVILTLMPIIGIGFLFAGLALLYKRIEKLFQIIQFIFVGLIAAPTGDIKLLKILPVTQGSYLMQIAMKNGIQLWEFPISEIGILIIVSTVYLAAGYYCFHISINAVRVKGMMGHY